MPRLRPLRFLALFALSSALLPLALGSRFLALVRAQVAALRLSGAVQSRWGAGILRILGVELVLEGTPPARTCVIVANHLSYLDIPVLSALFAGRFVAKSEIASWPVLGKLASTVGTIFVVQGRRRDVLRVGHEMARTLAAGVPVVLFPEGHSTRGSGVDRLHTALLECAVRSRIPCLAVTLGYETPGEPWAPAATVCWWGGMRFWRHAWNLVGLERVRVTVRIAPEARLGTDRKSLSAVLHADLLARFVPVGQAPIAPDYPWPELFRESHSPRDGVLERS